MLGLLLTGLVVEIALIPFALYHFHKAGLYGVAANLIAIPLTTFVIMPLEALALLLDSVGLGAPLWAATGWSIDLHARPRPPRRRRRGRGGDAADDAALGVRRDGRRRAVAVPVARPGAALGGRCRSRSARSGAALAPVPDLLVTGDGEHLAIVRADGVPVLLRDRSGDFVRSLMSEAAAYRRRPAARSRNSASRAAAAMPASPTSSATGGAWRLLAIRSRDRIDWATLTARLRAMPTSSSPSRRLPRGCTPRWLKLDRAALAQSGGVAIYLGDQPRLDSVAERLGAASVASGRRRVSSVAPHRELASRPDR